MANRAVYSIYFDTQVRERARNCGLNVSRICENRLRFLLQRLDDASINPEMESTRIDSQKSSKEVQIH
jgi:hypothetical protein